MGGLSRNQLLSCGLLLVSCVLALVGGEYGIRSLGYKPRHPRFPERPNFRGFEPDAALGWKKKAGRFVEPPYLPGQPDITYTHLSDLSRASAPTRIPRKKKIIIVGCSYSYGWGVSDQDTFAWKLQSKFPEYEVLNLANPGFSGFQSLLTLEDYFKTNKDPAIILYGYIGDHKRRNIASADWVYHISRSSRMIDLSVPYVTLEGNSFLRHAPISQKTWPFDQSLALVNFVESSLSKLLGTYFDLDQDTRSYIAAKLAEEMNGLSKEHSSQFKVVILDSLRANGMEDDIAQLKKLKVPYINCALPLTDDQLVPGEHQHPNGIAHSLYADCIESQLKREPGL